MATIQDTATLEAQAVEFFQAGLEIAKLEESREAIKANVGRLMKLSEQDEYRFGIDTLSDLKIKVGDRKVKIVNKAELATDMGVAESAINLEFLMQSVENNKLSVAKYKQYVSEEYMEQVSIRRVNADN
jgi:hypothetical protein